MSDIQPEEIVISPHIALMRKILRGFAVFWFLVALLVLVTGSVKLINDWQNPENYEFVMFVFGITFAGWVCWKLGGFVTTFSRRSEAMIQNADPDTVHGVEVQTGTSSHRYVEITHGNDDMDTEPMIVENSRGEVLFDSTQRPIRLLFGGFFLVVGLIIGLVMFLLADKPGTFEYIFVIGWSAMALFVMGFVYEVTLHKHSGNIDKKAGWFFIVFKRHYALRDFDRVIVETHFYRSRYNSMQNRNESQAPKFCVDLGGNRRLNLRVFSRLSDAQQMGKEVAAYLCLPLRETAEVC